MFPARQGGGFGVKLLVVGGALADVGDIAADHDGRRKLLGRDFVDQPLSNFFGFVASVSFGSVNRMSPYVITTVR